MKKIVACGCSFTHGYYVDKNNNRKAHTPYVELYAKKYNHNIINLAKPGATNYLVIKQVEFARSLKPDFLIIGLTSWYRFDYRQNIGAPDIERRPHLTDWSYSDQGKTRFTKEQGVFNSNSLMWLTTDPGREHVGKALVSLTDYNIKQDQDMYMTYGMLNWISEQKIPFVVIDWAGLFYPSFNKRYLIKNLKWQYMLDQFREDDYHFNQAGQHYAADILERHVRDWKIWDPMV